jgi:hypothetical protein
MKRISLAVLTLALLSSLLYSQQMTTRLTSRASIEVAGVKLQLGMTKATIAERFVGIQTRKIDENYWIIGNVGEVRFKNDKLVYAERSWMTDGGDQIDAVFKAVDSVNRQGLTVCRVFANTPLAGMKGYTKDGEERDLGVRSERVLISCSERTIVIVKIEFPTRQSVDVSEEIGAYAIPAS